MPRVEIQDYNEAVDFPDDMDPAEIERILAVEYPSKNMTAVQGLQGTPTTGGYVPPPRAPGEPAPVYAKPDPSVTYQGAFEAAGRAIPSAGVELAKSAGGIMRAVGENVGVYGDESGKGIPALTEVGKNVTDFYGSIAAELASRNKNELEKTIHGGLTSAGVSISTYPLAALKGPNVALALMGLIETGSSYPELRDANVPKGKALVGSALSGGVEAITEKTGLDVIMDKSLAPFQKLVKNMAVELFTESGATAYQALIRLAAQNPDLTLGEFSEKVIPELYDTWKQTPIASGAQVGMYTAAEKVNAHLKEWKASKERVYYQENQRKQEALNQYSQRKAEEAGPGPAPAPPSGAPPAGGVSIQPPRPSTATPEAARPTIQPPPIEPSPKVGGPSLEQAMREDPAAAARVAQVAEEARKQAEAKAKAQPAVEIPENVLSAKGEVIEGKPTRTALSEQEMPGPAVFFGGPSEGLGQRLAGKLDENDVKTLTSISNITRNQPSDIGIRRDARKIQNILSDRTEDDYKVQRLFDLRDKLESIEKPEGQQLQQIIDKMLPASKGKIKIIKPSALPDLPTPEQSVPESRIASLSDTQRYWLEGLSEAIGGAEAKKYVTQKSGENEAIGWTGSGFDHVREGFDLQGFEFNRKVDLQAIRKALEGKKLGTRDADRVREFLQAWRDRTSQEADYVANEPVEEVPFDLFTGKPEAPKVGKLFDIAGEYNTRQATRNRAGMDTPEIVRMIKNLTGKYPKVAPGQIKTAMGIALGFYKPSSKNITVSEQAAEVEALVRRVLAHELGHGVHHMGTPETMKRGNILGIIAGFRNYMKKTLPEYPGAPSEVLSHEDRTRLRTEAESEARQTINAEKKARESDLFAGNRKVSPEEIKSIWNDVAARTKDPDLYDYISRLTAAQKKSVLVEAMKGISNIEIQRQINNTPYSNLEDKIKEIYKKKIKEELEKRKLYDAEVITEELKQVVRLIKPFNENDPKMVKQFFQPKELYADGISMAIIDPEFTKATAPNFYKAVHSWMETRPEFKAEYDKILGMVEGDREALLKDYQDAIEKGYSAHEQAIKKQIEHAKIGSMHGIYAHLVDENSAFWKLINKKEKEGVVVPPEKDPRYWLTEVPYTNAEVYVFLKQAFDEAGKALQKNKIDNELIGQYFQHMRVLNERSSILDEQGRPYSDKAAPHGHTKASAQEQLNKMKRDLGLERFAILEKAYKDMQNIWQEYVIKPIKESGMWSDALLKYAEANKYYAKFRTVENFSDNLADSFGGGEHGASIVGHIFPRHGSFQDIANPYIQTMLTGAQLIRAAHTNQARKFAIEFLARNFGPDTITRATQRWNGKFKETKIKNNANVGTVIYLQNGKPQAFYVKREIADIINMNQEKASDIVRLAQMAVSPIKAAQVKYNVLWAMRNVVRDFLGTLKKAHEIKDPLTLAYWYLRALPHALRDVSGRPLNDTLKWMYKNKMLAPDRLWGTVDRTEVDELQHMMASFGLSEVHYRNKVLKPLMKVFGTIEGITKFSERMSKVAGGLKNKQLIEQGKRSMKEAVYSVHEFWGTPNVLRRGIWGKALNAGFVYSNVNVQDLRSTVESAHQHPFAFAYKSILMNVLPAVITYGLAHGLFRAYMSDDEDDDNKEWYRGISKYQLDRYMNIPLGFDSNKKSIGLKIPFDYTGAPVYGTVLAGLEGRYGNDGIFRTMWEQNPYLSPMLMDFAGDMVDYTRGRELYDDFRNRPAIDTDIHKAGGARKAEEIAKYEWNKLGGSTIYRFNTEDPSRIKSDLENNLQEWPGRLASSFFFVSDYGIKEAAKETTAEVESERAKKRIDVKDTIQEDIKAKGGRPSGEDPYKLYEKLVDDGKIDPREQGAKQFAATYDRYMRGGADSARLETLMRADTDSRIALMEKYREDLSSEKFTALEAQALDEGLLKKSFWKKNELRKERK